MTASNHFWDDLAIQSYKTLLKKNPNNAKLHNNLGLAYLRTEQFSRAIRAFRKAIRCDKSFAEAHYHLGTTYERAGSVTQAIRSFAQYNKVTDSPSSVVSDRLEELKVHQI